MLMDELDRSGEASPKADAMKPIEDNVIQAGFSLSKLPKLWSSREDLHQYRSVFSNKVCEKTELWWHTLSVSTTIKAAYTKPPNVANRRVVLKLVEEQYLMREVEEQETRLLVYKRMNGRNEEREVCGSWRSQNGNNFVGWQSQQ